MDDDDDGQLDEDDVERYPDGTIKPDSEQEDNDGDGLFNEDPDWPYTFPEWDITTRPRTAIAWDDRGHFYLIVFEGDGNRGVTWQETVDFFRTKLPRWMREELPSFVANEPAYEGARIAP